MSLEEYATLLEAFKDDSSTTIILRLISECGMSLYEITSLRIENVRDGVIHIQPDPPKIHYISERDIPVAEDLINLIHKFTGEATVGFVFKNRKGGKFQSFSNLVNQLQTKVQKRTGIVMRPRGLLRGRIVEMLRNGSSIEDIGIFLGVGYTWKAGLNGREDNNDER